MKHFCLYTALKSSPDKVADMLAHEALALEALYMHDAAAFRIGEPDIFGQYETTNDAEHTYICQLAVDTLDLVTMLERLPATPAMLVVAADVISKHCLDLGDFEMVDEMTALANGYIAQLREVTP